MDVPPTNTPSPVLQPTLPYAPARPKGLSPLIDHIGPGYLVVKLPPPPLRWELARLGVLVIAVACLIALIGIVTQVRKATWQAAGTPTGDSVFLVLIVAPIVVLSFGAIMQFWALVRRFRNPPVGPPQTIAFCRPEAAREVEGAHLVLRVTVRVAPFNLLRGAPAYLSVETPSGRVFELLQGLSYFELEKLEAGLRKHLLAPRPKVVRAPYA